jgi:acetoin utilization protein AcuC
MGRDAAGLAAAPLLIGSEIFRTSRHGPGHPLAIPRVSLTLDLCRALGWLDEARYREAIPAPVEAIARFHDRLYIDAVREAERTGTVPLAAQTRFNLGVNGNPIYAEVFRRPATACGATLLGAELVRRGGTVYNPAGGTHHGRPDRASGYCVFNDPVLGLLALLDQGIAPIVYLDLDAHFGDGVQDAFHDDDRVFTLSIHEAGRWPMGRGSADSGEDRPGFGGIDDRAGGAACNLPVPAGFNDDELSFLFDAVVLPSIERRRPAAIVVQAGCDALADDPMTKLCLSNRALWRAVESVADLSPRLLVLGGGGYNPYAVGRCWSGLWGTLDGRDIPQRLPVAAEALLREVRWHHRRGRTPDARWLTELADPPRHGPIRDDIRDLARRANAAA